VFFVEYLAARFTLSALGATGRLIFNRWMLIFLVICYLIGYAKSEVLTAPMYGSIPPGPDSNPSVVPNWALPPLTIDQRLRALCIQIESSPEAKAISKQNGVAEACAALQRIR
jgi:hypothetical protein